MPDRRLRGGTDRPGQIEWTWVRDPSTGYEFDVQTRALRSGMEPVEGVPLHYGPRPRRDKPLTDLAGGSTTPRARATSADAEPVADDAPGQPGTDSGAVISGDAVAQAATGGPAVPTPTAGTNGTAAAVSDDTGAGDGTTSTGRRGRR